MLPSDILAQVRRIEILTGRLVSETFAGEYLSVFKGRGMEFAQVREYYPGDDVRSIDWNVTARTGRPYVRQYTEERELTVAIACDLSGSQFFGAVGRFKKEIAAELSAVLAFSAMRNNDKVGLFLLTDRIEKHVPPKKGRKHVLQVIRDILAFAPQSRGTDLGAALETMTRVLKRRCILFLISDFRDQGFEKPLKLAALKHDIIPVVIRDPREEALAPVDACLELEDPESGERAIVDGGAAAVRGHREQERTRRAELDRTFALYGLDAIEVRTDRSYIDPVVQFFQRRSRRLRH